MLCFVGHLLALIFFVNAQYVILNTTQGELKGTIEKSRAGRQFFAFYGIPYAEPPVGKLRFENPVPSKPWKGVKDCTGLPPACLSYEGENAFYGQEDCLYLNLYTPKLISDSPLPVMVFVYGGRFMYGNALPGRYGPHYFMDKDVILITFHYRLGVLGFLSMEDETLPGNYGLKDFAAVLRWVQENVRSFNGDKNRVTVAGGSSGASMTSYALMSPLTEGLFHRCISQSGFPFFGILQKGLPRKRALQVARNVGCTKELKDIVTCLKRVPAATLIEENYSFNTELESTIGSLLFGSVIEEEKGSEAFLVDTAERMFSRNTHIPWITGINSNEGGMSAIFQYFGVNPIAHELAVNYDKFFPILTGFTRDFNEVSEFKKVADRLKTHFFGDADIEKNPIAISKMLSLPYLVLLRKSLNVYRGPKYVYYYDHRNEESFSKMYGNPPLDLDFGVIHGDELISMFNWSDVITPVTKGVDLIVSEQLIEFWTNFAAFGDPNGTREKKWKLYNTSRIEHLHINNGEFRMRDELSKEIYDFLDELFSLISGIKKQ